MSACRTILITLTATVLAVVTAAESMAAESQAVRFILRMETLPVSGVHEGQPFFETTSVLIRFDTATGKMWRYDSKRQEQEGGDFRIISENFVLIKTDSLPDDKAENPGRFQLVAAAPRAKLKMRSADMITEGRQSLFILDSLTGKVWAYRATRTRRNREWIRTDSFELVEDTGGNMKKYNDAEIKSLPPEHFFRHLGKRNKVRHQYAAMWALGKKSKVQPELNDVIIDKAISLFETSEDPQVKKQCLGVMSETRDRRCLPVLLAALREDDSVDVRKMAAYYLLWFKDYDVLPALEKALENERDPKVVESIKTTIERINAAGAR